MILNYAQNCGVIWLRYSLFFYLKAKILINIKVHVWLNAEGKITSQVNVKCKAYNGDMHAGY